MFFAAFPTKPRSYHYLESSSTDIKSRDSHLAAANVPGASTAFFFGLGLWAWLSAKNPPAKFGIQLS